MNKDTEAGLLGFPEQKTSRLSSNAKLLLAFATGAVVSFMAVSYNQRPQQLVANTTNLANAAQYVPDSTGYKRYNEQIYVDYYSTSSNTTLNYLNKEYSTWQTWYLAFPTSDVKYCTPNDESNEYISNTWEEIQNTTCITGELVEYGDDCQLVYYSLDNEIAKDAFTQPRSYYNVEILNSDKIYIFYKEDHYNQETALKRETLRALGLEYEDLRKDMNTKFEIGAVNGTGNSFGPYDTSSIMHREVQSDQWPSEFEDYFTMGYATSLSEWDSYMLNVLYCPSRAMPEPMPLSEASHIHAFSTDTIFYFSSNKIGIKTRVYWSAEDPAYAWFYAPWNETIVDVFPSPADSSYVYVQTETALYTVNKYYIDPTLVWKNLPSSTVTIVAMNDGKIVLFYPDSSTGYVKIYYRSNVDFSQEYSFYDLYDYYYPTKVYAAAYGTSIYFTHRGYFYQHDISYGSVYTISYEDSSSVVAMVGNSGYEDGYFFVVKNDGTVRKMSSGGYFSDLTYSSVYSTECPSNLSTAVEFSRYYDYLYFLTPSGVICQASEYGSYIDKHLE